MEDQQLSVIVEQGDLGLGVTPVSEEEQEQIEKSK